MRLILAGVSPWVIVGLVSAAWALDIDKYPQLKEKGATLEKVSESLVTITHIVYDPDTGAPTSVSDPLSAEVLTKRRDLLQAQVDAVNALLTDMQKL